MWRSRLPTLIARKEERERRRITQTEIAEQTGIRQATVSTWMNWGEFQRLEGSVVGAFARYLDCEPSELYEWVPEGDEQGQLVAVQVG
jgi:DNA-binding Xre family transcriptional regulator